jgi:hypothetical protein
MLTQKMIKDTISGIFFPQTGRHFPVPSDSAQIRLNLIAPHVEVAMQNKSLLPIILISLVITIPLSAKIWRVDNNGGTPGDFTTLQAAHTGAASGDTLYVYGSPISYGSLSLTKKLTIIGPGYFLSQNPQTQANPAPAYATSINFNAGSSGSLMTGMQTTSQVVIATNVHHITLKRNYITWNSNNGAVILASGANSITVQQCYIRNLRPYNDGVGIQMDGSNTSIIINNNYIDMTTAGSDAIRGSATSVALVAHNVFSGDFVLLNSEVTNNIFHDGNFSGSSANVYLNNICTGTLLDTTGGNIQNAVMDDVFVGTGSADGKWQLTAGSVAIGAGTEGADIGMFGGGQPYVLSGIPSIPHIYYLTAPSAAEPGTPLQVRVKAKTGE